MPFETVNWGHYIFSWERDSIEINLKIFENMSFEKIEVNKSRPKHSEICFHSWSILVIFKSRDLTCETYLNMQA